MAAQKKWTSKLVILGIGTSVLVAGCSSNGSEKPQNAANGSGSTGELQPYEVVMLFPVNNQPKELQMVNEEINKITKEKMNATVKLVPISFGTWAQQTTVMLAGNEKIDIMYSSVRGSYTQTVAQGHFQPMDELIAKYGQNAKKALDEQNPLILNATKVNGKIYGLPNIKDLASDYGVTMRKDLVEKYKIDVNSIKTLDDLDAIFKVIKDNEPGVTPSVKYASSIIDSYVGAHIDLLGNGFGVLPKHDNGLKVVNWFETKEYADLLKTVRRWYQAGYIAKDAATDTETKYNLVKAGRGFSWLSSMKPGIEQQESRSTGKDMVSVRLSPPITTTDKITGSAWSITRSSGNPERAMMFLDLLYTNKELQNLLSWGVEGKHYVKKGDVIDFPEGVNASNSGYNLQQGYMFGNQFLSHIWNGDDPQLWDKMSKFNKNAVVSKALGFSFNAEPVKTEIAAVTNVQNQFKLALETGMIDPESKLPEFNKQLKAAGLDKIIAEKQKQLDEWAKSNK